MPLWVSVRESASARRRILFKVPRVCTNRVDCFVVAYVDCLYALQGVYCVDHTRVFGWRLLQQLLQQQLIPIGIFG